MKTIGHIRGVTMQRVGDHTLLTAPNVGGESVTILELNKAGGALWQAVQYPSTPRSLAALAASRRENGRRIGLARGREEANAFLAAMDGQRFTRLQDVGANLWGTVLLYTALWYIMTVLLGHWWEIVPVAWLQADSMSTTGILLGGASVLLNTMFCLTAFVCGYVAVGAVTNLLTGYRVLSNVVRTILSWFLVLLYAPFILMSFLIEADDAVNKIFMPTWSAIYRAIPTPFDIYFWIAGMFS